MLRTNLILILLVVASALGTVSSNYRARRLFTALEQAQVRMHGLDVEWGQLQLEQSTWAAPARIEKIARDQLHMKQPAADQVVIVEDAK